MDQIAGHASAIRHITPEELTTGGLSAEQQVALRRQVTRRFRGGVTPYLSSLVKTSEAVRRQFVPDYLEGLDFGRETPFEEGKNNRGIYGLERVYQDRAVLTPYFDCAAYCRYCFKKTRTLAGDGRVMSQDDIARALAYIAADPRIDTVLITGGDPLARPDMLEGILDGVSAIAHVNKIRIGTRHILFNPDQITDELCALLAGYNDV
jgi:lysine 2,3-aminomutase